MMIHCNLHWWLPLIEGLLLGVLAMLLHEGGHIFASVALGVRIRALRVRWQGLCMVRESGPPWKNLLISIAGPFANVMLLMTYHRHFDFALANLCYAVCNLLPIKGADGERALRCWYLIRANCASRRCACDEGVEPPRNSLKPAQ